VHELLRQELYRYFLIGGMPEAVQAYVNTGSIRESQAVHSELIDAFRRDFSKYAPRANKICLEEVFISVAKNVGEQIKYAHLAQDFSGVMIKHAFNLLAMAQVITPINSCNPPVLPLGASVQNKVFKAVMLDIGLMQYMCGFPMTLQDLDKNLLSIYRGALAEQFVAQELRLTQEQERIYYWQRAEKSSSAEVDYLGIQNNQVIPIEVKSGAAGKLRSMHLFLQQYSQSPYGYVFLDAPYQELLEQKLVFMPLYYIYAAFNRSGERERD
jgi:predicted AAA+ superfamily ATPase